MKNGEVFKLCRVSLWVTFPYSLLKKIPSIDGRDCVYLCETYKKFLAFYQFYQHAFIAINNYFQHVDTGL
jgi:hypothetical protein